MVVITGGSRGIGLALVRAAHSAGATVVAIARDPERLQAVAADAAENGATIQTVAADLTDDADRAHAFTQIVEQNGRIDGLVNNAGITKVGPSIDYDLADLRRILEVNVVSAMACSQAAASAMATAGSIVNIGSLTTFVGQPERTAYAASKTAVLGLTRTLAVEWGARGIRVNAIAPGYIETDITADLIGRGVLDRDAIEQRTPLRRFGRPQDVIGPTLFLLSDASAFVTGATVAVDGGWLSNGYVR
ncbi:SDR family NAD(P)-dependent oxidoreductase [Mycobacterium sp. NPDC003449]